MINYQAANQMIPGKFISSPDEIKPVDVPMDGRIAIFPSQNMDYIVVKKWGQNGLINEEKYIPESIAKKEAENKESNNSEIIAILKNIENLLSTRPNYGYHNNNYKGGNNGDRRYYNTNRTYSNKQNNNTQNESKQDKEYDTGNKIENTPITDNTITNGKED